MTDAYFDASKMSPGIHVVHHEAKNIWTYYLSGVLKRGWRVEIQEPVQQPIGAFIPLDDFEILVIQEAFDKRVWRAHKHKLADEWPQLQEALKDGANIKIIGADGREPVAALICPALLQELKGWLNTEPTRRGFQQRGLFLVTQNGLRL